MLHLNTPVAWIDGKSGFAGSELKDNVKVQLQRNGEVGNQVYEMNDWIPANDKFEHRPSNHNP